MTWYVAKHLIGFQMILKKFILLKRIQIFVRFCPEDHVKEKRNAAKKVRLSLSFANILLVKGPGGARSLWASRPVIQYFKLPIY